MQARESRAANPAFREAYQHETAANPPGNCPIPLRGNCAFEHLKECADLATHLNILSRKRQNA